MYEAILGGRRAPAYIPTSPAVRTLANGTMMYNFPDADLLVEVNKEFVTLVIDGIDVTSFDTTSSEFDDLVTLLTYLKEKNNV